MSPRPSKKEALIAAALGLVAEHGYSALTLDAVGKAAGVSKGGVLYHFPTKDALVVALIEQLAGGLAANQSTGLGEDPSVPGAATRAYLDTVTRPNETAEHQVTVAMLAAVAHDPHLLAPLQEQYRQWMARLDADGLPEVDAQIVRLAADGLWAAELFGLAPPDPVLRTAILTRLEQLTHPTAARPR
jgi:AcrR family transcriptional regulator